MNGILQDVRFALRHFSKRPLWTAMIVAVLALGIGANTAMYTGYDAWVMRPLDFHQPERLVALHETQPTLDRSGGVSARDLGDWLERQQSFEAVGAFGRTRVNLGDEYAPVRLDGTRVSASLFPMLGKAPVLGRGFTEQDDLPGQPGLVALISHQLWERRFGSDPQVVGRTVRLDGRPHEIVGVMEPGFLFPEWAEVWTPLGLDVDAGDRGDRRIDVFARLRSGSSPGSASAELEAIAAGLARQYPETNEGWSAAAVPLRDDMVPPVITTALTASLASGILVLLVLCANVASLILAQATARMRATAVRTALGADRWRLMRQSVTEGVLLALPAGALGAVVAVLGVRWTLSWVPVDPPYLFAMTGLNATGGFYTLLVSLLAGVACGLVPVARSSGVSVVNILKSGGTTSGRRRARFGNTLVIGELALSTTLLIGALLVVKSFLAMQEIDRGFRTDAVLTAELDLVGEGLQGQDDRLAAVDRILASLRQLDGADRVGVTTHLPAGAGHLTWGLQAQGRAYQPGEAVVATVQGIRGDYLEALKVPVLEGRGFTESERRDGGAVALVSRRLATRLWRDEATIGRLLRRSGGADASDDTWMRVVGVVGDVDYGRDLVTVGTLPDAQLYVPHAEVGGPRVVVALRGTRPPAELAGATRQALATSVPGIPAEVMDLETALFRVQWMNRYFGNQLAVYALLATAIAALGLYGVMTHSVGGRRRELAVRMAVGATRLDLIRLVLGDASRLAGAGIGIGLLLALGTTGFAAAMLYEVSARDPVVFGGVALLLAGVALGAAFLPARRASLFDPNAALRAE